MPTHFHMGHPTPWAEGFVVRFWNADGTFWVGNFQAEWGIDGVFDLPGSDALVIVASGAHYRVSKSNPEQCTYRESGVRAAVFDEKSQILVMAFAGGDLVGYHFDGSEAWLRERLSLEDIRILSCIDGVVTAEIECDYQKCL